MNLKSVDISDKDLEEGMTEMTIFFKEKGWHPMKVLLLTQLFQEMIEETFGVVRVERHEVDRGAIN